MCARLKDAGNCVRYVRADSPQSRWHLWRGHPAILTYMGYGGSAEYVQVLGLTLWSRADAGEETSFG